MGALMDRRKGNIHVPCCHWLAIIAALTAKVAV